VSWDFEGVRSLVGGLAGACLLTGLATRTLRGWVLSLAPAALALVIGVGVLAALPRVGDLDTAGWAGLAASVAAALSLLTTLPRERTGQELPWPRATWLALHLFAAAGFWIGLQRAALAPPQLAITLALAGVALGGALCARGVPPAAALPPLLAARTLATWLGTPAAAGAVTVLTGWAGAGGLALEAGWGAPLTAASLVALGATLWAGRAEAGALVLLPGAAGCVGLVGTAGWLGHPASATLAAGVVGLGGALGLHQAAARLQALRGHPADPADAAGDAALAGAALTLGALSLLLAEDTRVAQAGLPLATGAALGTAAALAITGPLLARLARPVLASDGLGHRYRWLGAWTGREASLRARHDPLLRALPELVGDAGEVLVAGCGSGVAVVRLLSAAPGLRVRAVESGPSKLALCRAALTPDELQRATLVQGDLRQVELGRPDLILLLDVLEAWPPAEQQALLARLAEALPPGGEFLFRGACPGPDASHVAWELYARLRWALAIDRVGRAPRFASATDYGRRLNQAGLAVTKAYAELGSAARIVLRCRRA
jgi:hypothetical protein